MDQPFLQGIGDGLDDKLFDKVSTDELELLGLRPHPDPISEASSLSSVKLPECNYRLKLPSVTLQRECCPNALQ